VDEVILLLGHGSRDPAGVAEFLDLVAEVRAVSERPVEAGVLEFAGPTIPSIPCAIERCVAHGFTRILAVPVLLLNAGHAQGDIPAKIAQARARHPEIELRLAEPLGIQRRLLEILEERIGEEVGNLVVRQEDSTVILLVGRGTTDAEANGDIYKIGRLLWERNRFALVECCFAGSTQPTITEGIAHCILLGARRILVVPYLINTGLLVRRIHTQAAQAQDAHPDVEIVVCRHLGVHPKLVQLLLARARALADSDVAPADPPIGRTWRYPPHHHHQNGQGDHHHTDHVSTPATESTR
jgi:sirohydrochlorin cobaltochelatase